MHRPSVRLATAHTTTIEQNPEEQIRTRAYELYEERGREDGHDQEDWLRAEAEITEKTMRTAA
jgi:chorismate mutase